MRMRWILLLPLLVAGDVAVGEGLKNLRVLPKTTTKDQVKEIMKAQAKALGVDCDHCHQVPDMASDANPNKNIARDMIRLTREINVKWLKGIKGAEKNPVTCGTCHRGHDEPPPFPSKTPAP